jgi:hypothetical protein
LPIASSNQPRTSFLAGNRPVPKAYSADQFFVDHQAGQDQHQSIFTDLARVFDLSDLHRQIGILSLQFVLSRKDAAPDRVTLGMSNAEDFDIEQDLFSRNKLTLREKH